MARRIGIAQALVNDPDFIILDEPTSGLDPVGCREVKDLVKILARRGKTVLLTSHLLADVEDVVDRAAVMYGGQIRASGTLEELLEQPGHRRLDLSGLNVEQSARLDAFLASEGLAHRSQPVRRDLEQLFLDVVAKARSEQIDSSGAQLAGKLATHLSGPDLLSQLSQAPAPAPTALPGLTPSEEIAAATLEKVLTKPVDLPVLPAVPKIDDEAVNAKLNALLGKKD
jgi:ABC-2 type transport system ATP-binding protein